MNKVVIPGYLPYLTEYELNCHFNIPEYRFIALLLQQIMIMIISVFMGVGTGLAVSKIHLKMYFEMENRTCKKHVLVWRWTVGLSVNWWSLSVAFHNMQVTPLLFTMVGDRYETQGLQCLYSNLRNDRGRWEPQISIMQTQLLYQSVKLFRRPTPSSSSISSSNMKSSSSCSWPSSPSWDSWNSHSRQSAIMPNYVDFFFTFLVTKVKSTL